jgi:hypothetical protein
MPTSVGSFARRKLRKIVDLLILSVSVLDCCPESGCVKAAGFNAPMFHNSTRCSTSMRDEDLGVGTSLISRGGLLFWKLA